MAATPTPREVPGTERVTGACRLTFQFFLSRVLGVWLWVIAPPFSEPQSTDPENRSRSFPGCRTGVGGVLVGKSSAD